LTGVCGGEVKAIVEGRVETMFGGFNVLDPVNAPSFLTA